MFLPGLCLLWVIRCQSLSLLFDGLRVKLCASIRAIETNSNSDMKNLITYWILFSLISLFELAFAKLIQWLPLWPYIKLMATCCLVLPCFDGAYYVYECLVRPCFSGNPQVVINRFNKLKELSDPKTEDFLTVAERYVKENGSEALEKLIASKGAMPNDVEVIKAVANTEKKGVATAIQSKCKEPNVAVEELTEKIAADTANWVKCGEPNLAQAEKKTVVAVEIKEMTAALAADRENKLPEITTSKKVQKEWTCAVCQVTTQSETTLNSHLQGRKHREKCEELKAAKQTDKNKGPSSSTGNKFDQAIQEPKMHSPGNGPNQNETKRPEKVQVKGTSEQWNQKNLKDAGPNQTKTKNQEEKVQVNGTSEQCNQKNPKNAGPNQSKTQKQDEKVQVNRPSKQSNQKNLKNAGPNQNKTVKQEEKVQANRTTGTCNQKTLKNAGAGMKQSQRWCIICNVRCPGEIDMASHLSGRKHLSRIQDMIGSAGGLHA